MSSWCCCYMMYSNKNDFVSMLVQMPAFMFGNSIHLRNAALVRSNSHLAKEIIAARQENAKMKKEVGHKDFTDEDVFQSQSCIRCIRLWSFSLSSSRLYYPWRLEVWSFHHPSNCVTNTFETENTQRDVRVIFQEKLMSFRQNQVRGLEQQLVSSFGKP